MSSLSKSFKKAVKKVKKTAKKAGNTVVDTANKAADTVTGTAGTVSNQVSREAEQLAREVDTLTRDTAKLAEQAYAESLAAGEAAWNEAVELSTRFLTDALSDVAEALAEDVYRKHLALLESMAETGYALLTNPTRYKEVDFLVGQSSQKKKDEDTHKTVSSLSQDESVQRTGNDARSKGLGTLSIGSGGSMTFGGGVEGSVGIAFDHPEQQQLRGFYGCGGVAGVTKGVSMSFQFGVWADMPSKLAGPVLAVSLGAGAGKFCGSTQVIFKMPVTEKEWTAFATSGRLDLAGLVISLGAELSTFSDDGVSATVGCGYTWVY
ncbi:hypothetical protein HV824_28035 [Myxococcus sp. AM009]|uniref:hypothetical protein n=1 Tax=unclassified Myxococcus TaxID=2648731 RepID=UPI0015951955|nr:MULTISPECIES: hypothetical protein [unclassified Myxococcus]NVJ01950.1 hypothetical protein [Myxococcus sp. AM009]NVJ17776.1 hypothetical protein [Myxococcus sp. AM010]